MLAAFLLAAGGCDDDDNTNAPTQPPGQGQGGGLSEPEEVREEISGVVSGGELDLVGAIEAAEADAGGTATEMQISVRRDGSVFYDGDVIAGDTVHDVELDIDTMDLTRSTTEPADGGDAADAALAQDADWAALIAAAEAEVGGDAFEIEADGSNGTFEVEVLVDSVVWEVLLNPDATIVRSTRDDAGDWADDQVDDD